MKIMILVMLQLNQLMQGLIFFWFAMSLKKKRR